MHVLRLCTYRKNWKGRYRLIIFNIYFTFWFTFFKVDCFFKECLQIFKESEFELHILIITLPLRSSQAISLFHSNILKENGSQNVTPSLFVWLHIYLLFVCLLLLFFVLLHILVNFDHGGRTSTKLCDGLIIHPHKWTFTIC